MLPEGFEWGQAIQWFAGPLVALRLHQTEVARMSQRVDDQSWFATLDRHLGWHAEKNVKCSSYDAGRAGVEHWVVRHEARLRQEVSEIVAKRPRDRV